MRRYTITINGKDVAVDVRELAAERFQVHVGGAVYDVAVSEENVVLAAPLRQPVPAVVETPSSIPPRVGSGAAAAPPQEVASALPPGGSSIITAPLPGLILSVDVANGASVTRGQSLVTLEAMKMRNSIRSPRDGVVHVIHVTAGQNVGHGDPLVEVTSS